MIMAVDCEFNVADLARGAGGWIEVETTCKKVKVRTHMWEKMKVRTHIWEKLKVRTHVGESESENTCGRK